GTAKGVCNDDLSAGLDFSGTLHTNAVAAHTDTVYYNDSTGNYNNSSTTVTDEIDKADAHPLVTPYNCTKGDPNYAVYNPPNSYTATGTASGCDGDLKSLFDLSGTTHTNAGDYPNDHWTFNMGNNANPNYQSASGTIDDCIAARDALVNYIGQLYFVTSGSS